MHAFPTFPHVFILSDGRNSYFCVEFGSLMRRLLLHLSHAVPKILLRARLKCSSLVIAFVSSLDKFDSMLLDIHYWNVIAFGVGYYDGTATLRLINFWG